MRNLLLFAFTAFGTVVFSQTNILVTNPLADAVLKGNYTPSDYAASNAIDDKSAIVQGINAGVNPDSLKAYIIRMAEFYNRNTGSDTLSPVTGIGAARQWAYDKFTEFSAQNENRLLVSYLRFDQTICSVTRHRNIFAVLPGSDVNNHEVVIIEGHIDSRCLGVCDTACLAEGIEDNASGAALVLELARVMSQNTYRNSIVFMLTIGEEQGLYGANAFSQYAVNNDLPLKAVFNNDVVGGIICGETSSPPSCPGLNDIDSTSVRLFSYGSNTLNKQLARFTHLEYREELLPQVAVPMTIYIMSGEDRIGRGGDHIPFREDGYPAIRTTAANEHGDASNGTGYTDRQHTSDDILGVDTDNDMIIDSFFVDFNYLARNSVINGVSAAMAAIGPKTPDFDVVSYNDSSLTVTIIPDMAYPEYRIALRTTGTDWDTVYTTTSQVETIYLDSNNFYFVSVATVDSSGTESLFSPEKTISHYWLALEEEPDLPGAGYTLLQNRPNPFDEATIISVYVSQPEKYHRAEIIIQDLAGNLVKALPIALDYGTNDVLYEHGYGAQGVYMYSLVVDGQVISKKRMVFAN